MWDNPRQLNMAAGFFVGIAVLLFSLAALLALTRSELFPIRELVVSSAMQRTTKQEIETVLRGRVSGNFFAAPLAEVRAALEALPWVRRAAVRRVWPDRLEVLLEEHVALARWGEEALINTYGERFSGKTTEVLPLFIGPGGMEAEVTRRYLRFVQSVAPLGTEPERVVLTPRYAWQLRLKNGLHLMLGRDGDLAEARLARFVAVHDKTLGRIARRHEYVDLRYPNGFALRVAERRS
jgi:cell division protein FtsQ